MITTQQVRKALQLEDFDVWEAQRQMFPGPRPRVREPGLSGDPRQGAVLLLLHRWREQLALVLIKRPVTMRDHAGQISLPGGRQEEGESLQQAAVRETCEEIGICHDTITILGQISTIYIPPTDFEVYPFVGWYEGQPDFQANPKEVDEIIQATLPQLMDPDTRQEEPWTIRGYEIMVPFFQIGEHKVWGATAIIMAEFLGRLEQIVQGSQPPA